MTEDFICPKHGELHPEHIKTRKQGCRIITICNKCKKESVERYNEKNREKIVERQKKYYQENKETLMKESNERRRKKTAKLEIKPIKNIDSLIRCDKCNIPDKKFIEIRINARKIYLCSFCIKLLAMEFE